MADFGVFDEGLLVPSISQLREAWEESCRDKFGRDFPLGDFTFAGHIIGLLVEQVGLLWEVAEVAYGSIDPDSASGNMLRAVGALTGTFELPESSSVAVVTLTGAASTVVPQGSIISQSAGKRFATAITDTLVALDAWVPSTLYAVGDRVTNSSRAYQCITAGVSDGSGGPVDTLEDETDGAAHWTYLGEGDSAVDVVATCTETGPIVAVARSLSTIETPVGGWESAINLLDAVLGRDKQTDESFRLMREQELHAPGTGPFEAVRTALLQLDGVTSVSLLFNNGDVTDVNGLPPHSVEALVIGGDDQVIWQALWDNVPIGIQTYGGESGTVIDSEGRDQTLSFSRPTQKLIHVEVTLEMDDELYVGDDAVKEAIATWGNGTLGLGDEVYSSAVGARAFVTGVDNVTQTLISIDPVDPPVSSATLTMGVRDLPVFDTSRITVISS